MLEFEELWSVVDDTITERATNVDRHTKFYKAIIIFRVSDEVQTPIRDSTTATYA